MNYIKKIRINIGSFLLKQKIKNRKQKPVAINLNQAKKIALVFNATIENDRQTVKKLEAYFSELKIKVETLGYSNLKPNGDTLIGDNMHHYIHINDFNWFYQSKNESLTQFIQTEFDILIDLYQDEEFAITYILESSNAKFKVGCAHLDKGLHDLMIDVSKKKGDSTYLAEQIKHYLTILNT